MEQADARADLPLLDLQAHGGRRQGELEGGPVADLQVVRAFEERRVTQARVALGGVATKPWRSAEAEKVLVGAKPEQKTYVAAARAALKGARPRKHNGFKVELARRVIVRALTVVGEMS
jgi:xanthine dehydrogenase YagS FAD-binding subunit